MVGGLEHHLCINESDNANIMKYGYRCQNMTIESQRRTSQSHILSGTELTRSLYTNGQEAWLKMDKKKLFQTLNFHN